MRKFLTSFTLILITKISWSQNVGIGTTAPVARLHVTDSNVVFTGPVILPATTNFNPPLQGAGTRMMWYPQKAAFRTGTVTNTYWDKDSIGKYSFAAGFNVMASGLNTVAMGNTARATGIESTAIGPYTLAANTASVSIGEGNIASGYGSLALGGITIASGSNATARGNETIASGTVSTAMGNQTTASGDFSFAAGDSSVASGAHSIAMGSHNNAAGTGSFTAGISTVAIGNYATAFGFRSASLMQNAFAAGESDTASGQNSIALGSLNKSTGHYSISVGTSNKALAYQSIAIGYNAIAASANSISIGLSNTASGYASAAIGLGCAASGSESVALGYSANATGTGSISLGRNTLSSGNSSFASGNQTTAAGDYSTAAGFSSTASGLSSFAAGNGTLATGSNSASFGYGTKAKSNNSFVAGQFNDTTTMNSLFEIGMGTSNINRKNAVTVLNTGQVGIGITNPTGIFNVGIGTVRFDGLAVSGTGLPSLSLGGYGHIVVDAPGVVGGRFFIGENGNVGIGKYNPTQRLEIKTGNSGSSHVSYAMIGLESNTHNYISILTGYDGETGVLFGNPYSSADGGLVYHSITNQVDPRALYFIAGWNTRMKLYNSGNAWLQGSLSQNSDERMKKNITQLSSPLASLLRINGYTYHWKNDSLDHRQQIGVLAQELQQVYPQLVTANSDGELSVNYIGLIPVLLEGMKEQQKQIEDLKQVLQKIQDQ